MKDILGGGTPPCTHPEEESFNRKDFQSPAHPKRLRLFPTTMEMLPIHVLTVHWGRLTSCPGGTEGSKQWNLAASGFAQISVPDAPFRANATPLLPCHVSHISRKGSWLKGCGGIIKCGEPKHCPSGTPGALGRGAVDPRGINHQQCN